MVPNILIVPLRDKVKGTALYHKPYRSDRKPPALSFLGNNGRGLGAQHPPFRVPQVDAVEAPGGNEAGQQWRDSERWSDQAGGVNTHQDAFRGNGGCSLDVCILRRHGEESSPAILLSARQLGQGGAGWTTSALAPGPRPSIHREGRLQEGGHLGICTQDPHTRSKDKFFNFFTPSFSL